MYVLEPCEVEEPPVVVPVGVDVVPVPVEVVGPLVAAPVTTTSYLV